MKILYGLLPALVIILIVCVCIFSKYEKKLEKNQTKISEFNISDLSVKEHDYLLFEKNNHNFKQIIHSPDCKCNKKVDFFPF